LPEGDINVDNKRVFDNASTLKKHITRKMETDELFTEKVKENQLTILMLTEMPVKKEKEIEKKNTKPKNDDISTQNEINLNNNSDNNEVKPKPDPTPKPIPATTYDAKISADGNA